MDVHPDVARGILGDEAELAPHPREGGIFHELALRLVEPQHPAAGHRHDAASDPAQADAVSYGNLAQPRRPCRSPGIELHSPQTVDRRRAPEDSVLSFLDRANLLGDAGNTAFESPPPRFAPDGAEPGGGPQPDAVRVPVR